MNNPPREPDSRALLVGLAAGEDLPPLDLLEKGTVPFHEPGLDELVAGGLASGRLRFTTDYAETRGTDLIIVAVPHHLHAEVIPKIAAAEYRDWREMLRVLSSERLPSAYPCAGGG